MLPRTFVASQAATGLLWDRDVSCALGWGLPEEPHSVRNQGSDS